MKNKLNNALEDLDKAFESLEVKPLSNDELSRVSAGSGGECEDSVFNCETILGLTCNSKCGETGFWECPSESLSCEPGGTEIYEHGCEFTNTPGFLGCL